MDFQQWKINIFYIMASEYTRREAPLLEEVFVVLHALYGVEWSRRPVGVDMNTVAGKETVWYFQSWKGKKPMKWV